MKGQLPDPARSNLRALVEAVDRDVARLGPPGAEDEGAQDGLRASWRALVDSLALGPEPEYRVCPKCGGIGMRAATLCAYCWAKLTPTDAPAA